MGTLAISVTEFSRGLSDFLNHVQYRGQVLDIERGKRVVARVSPVAATDGFPVDRLDDLLAQGPQLDASDRGPMTRDLRAVRSQLASARRKSDPWAS